MAHSQTITRRAWRRTDDFTPNTPKVILTTEPIPLPLDPTAVLIKVHAVALNYRDANIAHGGNPWPVIPRGILGTDAAGEVIAVGDHVKRFKVGDRVAPIADTELITGRESTRSWLAANEDGVMADHLVFDESKLVKLPGYLDWVAASTVPCAGTTAWSAVKGASLGKTILLQGTGGVSIFALKLCRAAGTRVIVASSSPEKLSRLQEQYPHPQLLTVNYREPDWHQKVLDLTDGTGVDIVLENGGASSLVQSALCTRRGGIISQVGYLGKQDPEMLKELIPTIIDRRVTIRGINCSTRFEFEDLCEALSAGKIEIDDIVDKKYSFEQAEEALQYLWERKQVGKIVLEV